jgi:Asp-tRNA(Asn)/Glu-tRNA(Gln) amidotransferase A subunit family amidase
LSPLDGIAVAVKDNIDVAGVPTTNGFDGTHRVVDTDAEVIRRLRGAGAVVLGKLNMREGALGGSATARIMAAPPSLPRRIYARWLERRLGCSGRRRAVRGGARYRYRRLGSHPRRLLRRGWSQAQLRARQHTRCRALELPVGPCGVLDTLGG